MHLNYGLGHDDLLTCIKALEMGELYLINESVKNPSGFSGYMREVSQFVNLEIELKSILGLDLHESIISVRTEKGE